MRGRRARRHEAHYRFRLPPPLNRHDARVLLRATSGDERLCSEPKRGADRDHGRPAGVHGLDDLGVVDPLEVNRGDSEMLCPSWRWMTMSGTRSWAISTAWACRS